jgi:hypothetical protein
MKFSKSFERDYNWYFKWRSVFNFDGNNNYVNKQGRDLIVPSVNGKSAKECFYIFDSIGKIEPCREPELLKEILRAKGSINFNIKMWGESRAEGTLPKIEFTEIVKEFSLLDWMVEAVENLKAKHWENVQELKPIFEKYRKANI